MSNYLAPGVFVEEVSFRSRSIEGVSTSVAAIVGPTRFGPLRGRPEVVTSFADFQRIYGDIQNLSLGGDDTLNHTAIAAKTFFDNGGKQLYVSRVANLPDPDNSVGTASDSENHVIFRSRFPGAMGNVTLEFEWRDSENLLQLQPVSSPAIDEVLFLEATGVTNAVRTGAGPDDSMFPLTIRALVRRTAEDTYTVLNDFYQITSDNPGDPTTFDTNGDGEPLLAAAGLTRNNTDSLQFTRVSVRQPASGSLEGGAFGALSFSESTNLESFFEGDHWAGSPGRTSGAHAPHTGTTGAGFAGRPQGTKTGLRAGKRLRGPAGPVLPEDQTALSTDPYRFHRQRKAQYCGTGD